MIAKSASVFWTEAKASAKLSLGYRLAELPKDSTAAWEVVSTDQNWFREQIGLTWWEKEAAGPRNATLRGSMDHGKVTQLSPRGFLAMCIRRKSAASAHILKRNGNSGSRWL